RIALPSSNSSARRRPRRASRSNARSMSEPMKKASRSPMPKWTPSTSPAMRSIRIGTTQSNPAGSQNRSSYIVMGVLSVPLGLSPNPMAQGDGFQFRAELLPVGRRQAGEAVDLFDQHNV